ncbi:MAG: hypothetical protein IT449_11290 [Phycisphaerales bacterium]|nr:hypothetical protein [Phycisphaerales bacterium]
MKRTYLIIAFAVPTAFAVVSTFAVDSDFAVVSAFDVGTDGSFPADRLENGSSALTRYQAPPQPPSKPDADPSPPARSDAPAPLPSTPETLPSAQKKPDRANYAEHVVIDWRFPLVELEARVVLRAGPLELLACSPGTREHESILQIPAKPLRVFEALGLIGLTPGAPVRYDAAKDQWIAPTGDRLMLRVLAEFPFGKATMPVEAWLLDLKDRSRKIEAIPWVFAGSDRLEDGAFGADVDGTIVCVVDFSSALMTVGEAHSADDEVLWLGADPAFVPREGTRCSLLISAPPQDMRKAEVTADGKLLLGGKEVSVDQLVVDWKSSSTTPQAQQEKSPQPFAPGESDKEVALGESAGQVVPGEARNSRLRLIELSPVGKVKRDALRPHVEALLAAGVPASAILIDPRRFE